MLAGYESYDNRTLPTIKNNMLKLAFQSIIRML